jgi:hypothetical protein
VALLYESGAGEEWADTAIQINTTLQASGFSVFSTFFLSAQVPVYKELCTRMDVFEASLSHYTHVHSADSSAASASTSRLSALNAIQESGYRIILVVGSCNSSVLLCADAQTLRMQKGYALITTTHLDGITCLSESINYSPKRATASVPEGKQTTLLLAEPDRPAMSRYLVRVPRFTYQACS